jgi:hypothetical protein
MVAYNKYDQFVLDFVNGVHDFDTHVYKTMLSNTAPVVATNAVRADVTELTTTGGYTSGGITITIATSKSGTNPATAKVATTTNPLWTGSGAGFTFRYAIVYDDTPTSPADPLLAFWDYGSSQLVATGETLTVDFDDTNGIFTVT